MIRYLAFSWNSADPSATEFARALVERMPCQVPTWSSAFESAGLVVYVKSANSTPDLTYRLLNGGGIVLGTLFDSSGKRQVTLNEAQSQAIMSTDGKDLTRSYWGRYVAFLRNQGSRTTRVVRDPTGSILCLTAKVQGVDLFFSRLADCELVHKPASAIDWNHIRDFLAYGGLPKEHTGVQAIAQVMPGQCLAIEPTRNTKTFYWNPLKIATAGPIEDAGEAISSLRSATKSCVHAWASCYESILHLLSGGLDSAVVLACLLDAPTRPRVTCLNYYAKGADGDERRYARLAASRAGIDLIEREELPESNWASVLDAPRTPYVPFYIDGMRTALHLSQLAKECHAAARFSGHGGDVLFYRNRGYFAAADYAYMHGIGPRFVRIALNTARAERTSIWSVFAQALRYGVLRRAWKILPELDATLSLMTDRAVEMTRQDASDFHTLYKHIGSVPRGKIYQSRTITYALCPYYSPFESLTDPDEVSPLFSQPLIEMCLRIPVHILMHGGHDRALARRAFWNEIPREIAVRRSKGTSESYVKDSLLNNIEWGRHLLLGGILVQQEILDPRKISQFLSREPSRMGSRTTQLMSCVNAEVWARSWAAGAQRVAA
jgi:asparagine synthase (glutamine-hydrolysing)